MITETCAVLVYKSNNIISNIYWMFYGYFVSDVDKIREIIRDMRTEDGSGSE